MNSAEIKDAMRKRLPVVCGDYEYTRINAYIYRICENPHTNRLEERFQLELQSKRGNSVVVVDANKVRLKE